VYQAVLSTEIEATEEGEKREEEGGRRERRGGVEERREL
jgi:hypothetical protein